MTFDLEVSTEVADALHRIANEVQPKRPLTREECATPELRLEYIAQWLEAGASSCSGVDAFNMLAIADEKDCGTVCCIMGCVQIWFGERRMPDTKAAGLIGIHDRSVIDELFYALHAHGVGLGSITPAWAARCIRKYQREGVVDWAGTR